MQDRCDSRQWPKDKLQAKRDIRYESARRVNGQVDRSSLCTLSSQ